MFGKLKNQNALEPPPISETQRSAVEVLRVWAAPGNPQQLTLRTTWKNPAAWGLLLADVAWHAAQAYASEGEAPQIVLSRIRESFEAEWKTRTGDPKDITPH